LKRPSTSSQTALKYLDAIDNAGGKAKRMDFLRIAGSEANLNRWVAFLEENKFVKEIQQEGRKIYVKTQMGQRFHDVLKQHEIVFVLTQELSGRKLRRWR